MAVQEQTTVSENPEREWTPTQRRMLKILEDGERHSKAELHTCLADDLAPLSGTAVVFHLSKLRDKVERQGFMIICEWFQRKRWYRMVRRLTNS